MVKPSKPLVGYPRVSRKGDRDELRSPKIQRQRMRQYAQAEGFELEFSEAEVDVSGSKPNRAILDRIIARIEAGEVGGIVVAKLDRLSRLSPKDRVLLFERIESAGGVVLSAGEQLDPSTPEGRFAREVFLGIARMQWEKYREGFEDAKAGAVARGIPVHTRPPVGYRQRADRRLEPNPAVAPVVREVFERRAKGAGPLELATLLEREGVSTSQRSATWSKQAIYNMLGNRVYLGELRYGRDNRYVNAASHEPIVDLALWTAAQHPNGRQHRPDHRSAWLLAGLVRCARCRHSCQGTVTSRGVRIYRCTVRHAGGICPAPARVDAERLERAVVDTFWSVTADLETHGTTDTRTDLSGPEEAFARTESALRGYMAPAIQEAIGDPSLWAAGLRERREARDAAAVELGRARADAQEHEEPVGVDTLRAAWERMTTVQRRDRLALRFDAIALHRDPVGVVIYAKGEAPADLPRRGFKSAPTLQPFPLAEGVPVVALAG